MLLSPNANVPSSQQCSHANLNGHREPVSKSGRRSKDGDDQEAMQNDQQPSLSSSSCSKEGKYSCIGRITWLNGNETELDDEGEISEVFDDDDDNDIDDSGGDDETSSSDETIVRKETRWAWLVVFSSFVIHMLADGITFSFGVLLHRLIDVFGVSKDKVALVGSLLGGIPLFMGPVCSILINRFGCRTVTITGGLLTGIGFILSSYVTQFDLFFLTMSLLSGFGLSLVYLPAVIVVAYYFEENRSLATGLAVSGTGLGYALFAPVIDIMLDKLDWQETLRILGTLFLTISLCGLSFRPIEYKVEKKKKTMEELERMRKREVKKRRLERKRLRKAFLDDSRLPSRMSSNEKLERFIQHMQEAEEAEAAAASAGCFIIGDSNDEDESDESDHDSTIAHKKTRLKRKKQVKSHNSLALTVDDNNELDDKQQSGSKRSRYQSETVSSESKDKAKSPVSKTAKDENKISSLIKSFSIAALPSFYLDPSGGGDSEPGEKSRSPNSSQKLDQSNVTSKVSSKSTQHVTFSSRRTSTDDNNNDSECQHDRVLIVFKPNLSSHLLVTSASKTQSPSHVECTTPPSDIGQLCSPIRHEQKLDTTNSAVGSIYENQSGVGTYLLTTMFDNRDVDACNPIHQPLPSDQVQHMQRFTGKSRYQMKRHNQMTKQDLLRAYNMPLCRKDIFYRGSLLNIRRALIKPTTRSSRFNKRSLLTPNIDHASNSLLSNNSITLSCPNLYLRHPDGSSSSSSSSLSSTDSSSSSSDKTVSAGHKTTCLSRLKRHLKPRKHLFSFSVLRNPTFLLFCFANFIFYMWHEIPMMFIRDYTDECKCMEKHKVWFLFISCGLANAFGQWIYGYLGDRDNINENILYAVSTIVCGVTVLTIPLMLRHFLLMLANQILFGLFLSANFVLNSIILVEILGVDKLTDAYGMLLLVQGFALVIGAPIAGWIGEITTYNNTFYVSGLFIVISGVLLLFIPLVDAYYKKYIEKKRRLYFQKKRQKRLANCYLSSTHNMKPPFSTMETINEIEEKPKEH